MSSGGGNFGAVNNFGANAPTAQGGGGGGGFNMGAGGGNDEKKSRRKVRVKRR